MAIFDGYVKKMAEYLEGMRQKGRRVRVSNYPASVQELLDGLPLRVGPGARPGIILRTDTGIELGNPAAGSCAFVLWTDDPSLVEDGRITLVGPDIRESGGNDLPLGQVLIIGGTGLSSKEHTALEGAQHVSDQIEGYMVKSMTGRVWGRVSKEAAEKGFSFEVLGKALMALYKSEIPRVEAMETIFVTSGKEDVQQLDAIAVQVNEISKNVVKENWRARGIDIDECSFSGDCSSCGSKPVCDDIRDVTTARKKKRREEVVND